MDPDRQSNLTEQKCCSDEKAQGVSAAPAEALAPAPKVFGGFAKPKRQKMPKLTVAQVAHGAVALAKCVIKVGRRSESGTQACREKCRDCEHATRNENQLHLPTKGLSALSRCLKCGCVIRCKTSDRGEACPIGEWGPEE